MSILSLWYSLTGYLVISVRGAAAEKFINLVIRKGIHLWDVRRSADKAIFKANIESFFEMRQIARATGCRLHIERKAGLPFFFSSLRRRRGLAIGLVFFIVALYLLSSLVLFIEVEGSENVSEERIIRLAEELGIRPGVWKRQLEIEILANEFVLREPALAWVSFKMRGTRLVIKVVEKIVTPSTHSGPLNIISAKDGLVVDVLVVMGEPRVRPGDTVARGQLLIEGLLAPQSPFLSPDETPPAPVPVRAQGEVWARVWYEGYGEAALCEVTSIRTGSRTGSYTLVWKGGEILRLGRQVIPFRNYELQMIKRDFSKRIIRFPVEINTQYAYELRLQENTFTHEEAMEKAAERARTLATLQLPRGVPVKASSVEEIETKDTETVTVRYVLETYENIAIEELTGGD